MSAGSHTHTSLIPGTEHCPSQISRRKALVKLWDVLLTELLAIASRQDGVDPEEEDFVQEARQSLWGLLCIGFEKNVSFASTLQDQKNQRHHWKRVGIKIVCVSTCHWYPQRLTSQFDQQINRDEIGRLD